MAARAAAAKPRRPTTAMPATPPVFVSIFPVRLGSREKMLGAGGWRRVCGACGGALRYGAGTGSELKTMTAGMWYWRADAADGRRAGAALLLWWRWKTGSC